MPKIDHFHGIFDENFGLIGLTVNLFKLHFVYGLPPSESAKGNA